MKFRNNGAVGAILDEYEKALDELDKILIDVNEEELVKIVDHQTKDSDCKSIQSILTHVIRSGYCYVIEVRNSLGEKIEKVERKTLNSVDQYRNELEKMFKYNEQLFIDYPEIKLEEFDSSKKILVGWGQKYDVEQLFEHAIVHILRHRRQIERFILKLK